jgi:hypothetical protein
MKSLTAHRTSRAVLRTTSCVAVLLAATGVSASEGFKTRQSPIGAFGGEISAGADNPGFFGTAVTTYVHIYKVADNDGNDIAVTGRSIPLPTQSKAGVADSRWHLHAECGAGHHPV